MFDFTRIAGAASASALDFYWYKTETIVISSKFQAEYHGTIAIVSFA